MLLISYTRSFFTDVSDPFAAVFGNESFGGGFADFSALAKVISRFLMNPLSHRFVHCIYNK